MAGCGVVSGPTDGAGCRDHAGDCARMPGSAPRWPARDRCGSARRRRSAHSDGRGGGEAVLCGLAVPRGDQRDDTQRMFAPGAAAPSVADHAVEIGPALRVASPIGLSRRRRQRGDASCRRGGHVRPRHRQVAETTPFRMMLSSTYGQQSGGRHQRAVMRRCTRNAPSLIGGSLS